jgi:hypothetical protein
MIPMINESFVPCKNRFITEVPYNNLPHTINFTASSNASGG